MSGVITESDVHACDLFLCGQICLAELFVVERRMDYLELDVCCFGVGF